MRRKRAIGRSVVVACAAAGGSSSASADVDLYFVAVDPAPRVGAMVQVELIAQSDSGVSEGVSGMDVVLAWDPAALTLLGVDTSGGGPFLAALFPPNDPFGLNEANPPADGDALFSALSQLANPFQATPEGSLVVTFNFEAVGPGRTVVEALPSGGSPMVTTKVLGTGGPNQNILDQTFPGLIVVGGPTCPADLSGDGVVDSIDLNILLAAFGGGGGGDIDGSGGTDSIDLNLLLADFGEECP